MEDAGKLLGTLAKGQNRQLLTSESVGQKELNHGDDVDISQPSVHLKAVAICNPLPRTFILT